jgi:alkanesulfonate monooxygenase SsuD/methylene tetrahydromethanopterin reductase-like flavin-dependent oxidoreductase (luciferase family)
MLELTARHADAWNTAWHRTPARVGEEYAKMLEACRKVGRDPATLELTAGTLAHVLAPGEAPKPDEKPIVGTAEEVAESLRAFAAIEVTHMVVQVEPTDLSGVERFAAVLDRLDADL